MDREKLYYEALKESIKSLPPEEQKRQIEEALAVFEDPDKWDEVPVDVETFIESEDYLALKNYVWPEVKKQIIEFYQGGYREAVFDEAIGAGKSWKASIIATYEVYRMLCLRNPQKNFGLAPKSRIAFMNMSLNKDNAKDIVFGNIQARIDDSPWFQRNAQRDQKIRSVIRFPKKHIYIVPGNSKETFPSGYNIFAAILDEAAWYLEKDEKESSAQKIYNAMDRRIRSRFKEFGKLVVISSPRYVDDFIERKMAEAKTDPAIYARRSMLWDVKPGFDLSEKATFPVRAQTDEGERIIRIPMLFFKDYHKNPEMFLRDFTATPSLTLEPYIKDLESIDDAFKLERIKNIWKQGYLLTDAADEYGTPCFIHVDLGLTKDACGIAMVTRYRNLIIAPLLARIQGNKNKEVDFSEVRDLIIRLRAKGFNIKKISFDGWQSVDSIQQLRKKFPKRGNEEVVEMLSIDRNLAPYDTLKGLLQERRLRLPQFEPLMKELKRLELIKGVKVDHPKGSSKDVADALAGACFWAAGNEISTPAIYSQTMRPDKVVKVGTKEADTVLIKN
jgi:hypothetical protein